MNTYKIRFLTSAAFAIATLSLNSVAVGQTDPRTHLNSSPRDLRVASKDDLKRSADKLTGDKLTARDGMKLGSIKDFLVEADSGRLRFAVVSTGGFAGVGDKLRLVPYYMLSQNGDDRSFTASITPDMLSRAPTINEEMFEENRVAVDSQQQQEINDAFSSSGANVRTSLSTPSLLVRATKLDGRDVMANGVRVGNIQSVEIERGATHALAVFKPEHRVESDGQRFLVPFSRLNIEVGKGAAITTTLTQSDFQATERANATTSAGHNETRDTLNAQQSSNVAADATSGTAAVAPTLTYRPKESSLPPTGHTSAEQNLRATPSLVSAAHSIRQALDADSVLAHADVRVTPEEGRVVVRGTVRSDKQKAAVERAADNAASSTSIDFDLTVRDQ